MLQQTELNKSNVSEACSLCKHKFHSYRALSHLPCLVQLNRTLVHLWFRHDLTSNWVNYRDCKASLIKAVQYVIVYDLPSLTLKVQ